MSNQTETNPIVERTDLPLDLREIEYHFAFIRAAIGGKLAAGSGPDATRHRAAVDKLDEACDLAIGPAWRDRYQARPTPSAPAP